MDLPPIETAVGVVKTGMAARVISVLLILCLAAGPVAFLVAVASAGRSVPAPAPAVSAVVDETVTGRVGEFAVAVVVATLGGSRTSTAPKWVAEVGSGESGLTVSNPMVVQVVEQLAVSEGKVWSATVAATVRAKGQAPVRQFFQVTVLIDPAGVLRVLGGVAQVAAPTYGEPGRLGYPDRLAEGPVLDAVSGFLAALLTGDGEVGRYTAPGSTIAAVIPAPYAAIDIVDVTAAAAGGAAAGEGAPVRVLASLIGQTSSQKVPLTYALTLSMRSGRWEVSAVDAAPLTRDLKTPGATPGSSRPAPAASSTTQ